MPCGKGCFGCVAPQIMLPAEMKFDVKKSVFLLVKITFISHLFGFRFPVSSE